MNALSHGERSAEAVETRAMLAACMCVVREGDRKLAELTRRRGDYLD